MIISDHLPRILLCRGSEKKVLLYQSTFVRCIFSFQNSDVPNSTSKISQSSSFYCHENIRENEHIKLFLWRLRSIVIFGIYYFPIWGEEASLLRLLVFNINMNFCFPSCHRINKDPTKNRHSTISDNRSLSSTNFIINKQFLEN